MKYKVYDNKLIEDKKIPHKDALLPKNARKKILEVYGVGFYNYLKLCKYESI